MASGNRGASTEPWYKVVTLRREVRDGRSFSPDEFAIALEQVIAGTAPSDYTDPVQFFSRTYFTKALTEHTVMVLRRLSGMTENTAPVLTLVTQFGGGKTHTLTSLYHLAKSGREADRLPGVTELLSHTDISQVPDTSVAVFVGNAWDPSDGRETPWIDLARQLAGDRGVAALGKSARTVPPGTEALTRLLAAVETPVLLLFDEVLNFVNRHRSMAESFYAFLQNLTVSIAGAPNAVAVISLPQSQAEMTEWDQKWQDRITKVVRRVAQDLIANDESEISEVVRRRLFEDLGDPGIRQQVASDYADWCFERSARLSPEWTAVDSATTRSGSRDFLQKRFESCYPFHPATLSVFQRKWSALLHFQQTRGALAMLAQWVSLAARSQFQDARAEPMITLGSAPLHSSDFRAVVLGQLGEHKLGVAIDADIAGKTSHARPLDADTSGALRDIHRRVGTAILFESSGGQIDKVAHLPELRFALGGPDVETTTIDNAALALEKSGFFMRRVGTDGYRIHHKATLRKVMNDRRASLGEKEVNLAIKDLVREELGRGATVPITYFPESGDEVQDSPRLTLIILDPIEEWHPGGRLAEDISRWTKKRGESSRLYPGALVWCVRKPGRSLQENVELWLAWKRVGLEVSRGLLGTEFDQADRAKVRFEVKEAENAAREEVRASYRFVVLGDMQAAGGLKTIDLGEGHSSSNKSMCGRIIATLVSGGLLSYSVGAGYIDRRWPPAFKDSGAWPLTSLRQSFLDGSLTRLIDPDAVLRRQIAEFVEHGDFGLASGDSSDSQYNRLWFAEPVRAEEIMFEARVFLLTKTKAQQLQNQSTNQTGQTQTTSTTSPSAEPETDAEPETGRPPKPPQAGQKAILRLKGTVPSESWNRLGIKILPMFKQHCKDLSVGVTFSVSVDVGMASALEADLRQALVDLGLDERIFIAVSDSSHGSDEAKSPRP